MITLISVIASNLGSILGESRWREALRRFWPIPVFTAVGSLTGTQAQLSADPSPFRLLLALVLIVYLYFARARLRLFEHLVLIDASAFPVCLAGIDHGVDGRRREHLLAGGGGLRAAFPDESRPDGGDF